MPIPEFLKEPLTIYQIAEQYWDLKAYPTQYFFSLLALVSDDKLEKEKCIEFSSAAGQEDWLNYSRRPKRTPLEVLHDFHRTASKLTIEILFELFSTIKPRAFSVASALVSNHTQLEILMAVVEYHTSIKKARLGLASTWLRDLVVGDRIYAWIKKGTFKFADYNIPQIMIGPGTGLTPFIGYIQDQVCRIFISFKNIPQIMIGPGTGLAPFRGYIQERVCKGTASEDILYLFFGCRYRERDFLCGRELEAEAEAGHITLHCAFSRDQPHKVYVQHKITEYKEVLWELIKEKQAHIYLSGNAKNMPDNVRDSFIDNVFSKAGGLTLEEAKSFMEELERTERYQSETW